MNARTLGSLSGRVFSHKGRSSNAKTSAAVQLVTVVMVVLFWSPQVDAYPQDKIYFAFLDWQLVQLTQAITKNPVIPLSAPKAVQGKAVQDGMSLADYKRDVEQAAAIHYRWRVEAARYNNGEIDRATYEAAIKNSSADYLSLYNKWWAAGRRSDFERDYQQRLNAMGWPVRPPKVVQGMPSADYKRDVEQAADLEFRKGQFRSDYENKEIDAATEDKSIKALDAVLTRLNEKWRVAGRGNEFRRDCMQQLRVVAIAHQSHPQPWRIPSGNLFAYTMVALLLLALGLAREIGPFGLDNADPFTIRSGWSTYQVYASTGTVLSPTKSEVVKTHVSGGGNNQPVSISTSTSIHDRFFIRENNGVERAVYLTNVDVALREGHQVSAAWSIRKGQKSGDYFLVRNHSTWNVDFVDSVVKSMLQPAIWLMLPMIFIALSMGAASVHMRISHLFALMSNDNTAASLIALFTAIVGVPVAFLIAYCIIADLRVRRLKRHVAAKLLPIFDKRATEQIAMPLGAAATPS